MLLAANQCQIINFFIKKKSSTIPMETIDIDVPLYDPVIVVKPRLERIMIGEGSLSKRELINKARDSAPTVIIRLES